MSQTTASPSKMQDLERRPCEYYGLVRGTRLQSAVFDEDAVWGHIGAGKIQSGRAPRRKKIKGGHER